MPIKYILLIALHFLPFLIFSQENNEKIILNNNSKNSLVLKINNLIEKKYIDSTIAVKMSNYITERNKEGAYSNFTDPINFTDALTKDLYSIYHDKHLLVQYNPTLKKQLLMDEVKQQKNTNDNSKRNKNENYGFKKVEIIYGNIGYLKLDHFWADYDEGEIILRSALQFIANTHALIIDLRANDGGSPKAVTQLCSAFFKTKIHINDTYSRPSNTLKEFWTSPDSSMELLSTIPLYILTSDKTFSAAEEFAYDMQNLKRATIIGEITGGGAHNTFERSIGNGCVVYLPYGKAINAITHTNWEDVGVIPDVIVTLDKALTTAEDTIFKMLQADAKDSDEVHALKWQQDILNALNNPFQIDSTTLKRYVGVFGERIFTYENGNLFYQRTGRPKYQLEAMTRTKMNGKDNTYFKIEFIENDHTLINQVNVHYQDGRMETSMRTK